MFLICATTAFCFHSIISDEVCRGWLRNRHSIVWKHNREKKGIAGRILLLDAEDIIRSERDPEKTKAESRI